MSAAAAHMPDPSVGSSGPGTPGAGTGRGPLGRLHIPPPIHTGHGLSGGVPVGAYSPAIQTARGVPGFSYGPLQTPLQTAFMHNNPRASMSLPMGVVPHQLGHRVHPSIALAAAAAAASGMPMTPGPHQLPPHMIQVPPTPGAVPFQARSRRAPSISTGGPPKAPLGGPQRKAPSPLPPTADSKAGPAEDAGSNAAPDTIQPAATAPSKSKPTKKIIVKLPQERNRVSQDGDDAAKPLWVREPLPHADIPEHEPIQPPELVSVKSHPMDWPRGVMPMSIDVFLPGKPAWEDMKRAIMEEKLSRLGVGRGINNLAASALQRNGSIALPHGRAASISSPADPALLLFKLNKLQQSQQATDTPSVGGSLASSPGPPLAGPVSPQPPIGTARPIKHGQSMSVAPGTNGYFSQQIPGFESGPFNPFGPGSILPAPDFAPAQRERDSSTSPLPLHAPQGVVPSQAVMLLPTSGRTSQASSRPDFTRGFGIDIPEEEEPDDDDYDVVKFASNVFGQPRPRTDTVSEADAASQTDADAEDEGDDHDDATVPAHSRIHSRHQSKLSAALSLRSVGGVRSEGDAADLEERARHDGLGSGRNFGSERIPQAQVDPAVADAVAEWTGSEDMRDAVEQSNDESEGEWSNPSDEERARQRRVQKRIMARMQAQETTTPRRLPNFPRPPLGESTFYQQQQQHLGTLHHQDDDDDMYSNPSDEERAAASGGRVSRPLPSIPTTHHLGSDGYPQLSTGFSHSRGGSGQQQYPSMPVPAPAAALSLNPNAKPFVFGQPRSNVTSTSAPAPTGPPSTGSPAGGHERQLSLNARLNVGAPEFKPTFTFRPPEPAPTLAFPEPVTLWNSGAQARAEQGREKRFRRSSEDGTVDLDLDDTQSETSETSDVRSRDGRDNIATWSFPMNKSATIAAPPQHASAAVPPTPGLNPGAKEFKFSALASSFSAPAAPPVKKAVVEPETSRTPSPEASLVNGPSPVRSLDSEPAHLALEIEESVRTALSGTPSAAMTPTLPDYKHPVATGTAPAGLFKKAALERERTPQSPATMDGPTRGNVRSRLSSRDVLTTLGTRNSSLDDLDDFNVPSISRKVSKTMLLANEGVTPHMQMPVPEPHYGGSPSMQHGHGQAGVLSPPLSKGKMHVRPQSVDSLSEGSFSVSSGEHANRIDLDSYEQRLEDILEDKLEALKRDLVEAKALQNAAASGLSADAIAELIAAMRQQTQPATQGHTVSQSGGFDPGLLRNIIEESHLDIQRTLQADMQQMIASLSINRARSPMPHANNNLDVTRAIEESGSQAIVSINGVQQQLAARIDAIAELQHVQNAQVAEIVSQRIGTLNTRIEELRQPPVNVDVLTAQLAHAVKPNISQLIDLASDKKETAVLITKQLAPMIEKILAASQALDTDSIAAQLAAEINRIVPPVDQHALKEQVSDLVIERLDSRLAVRDRANNPDAVATRVINALGPVLEPVNGVRESLQRLTESQTSLVSQTDALLASHGDYLTHISTIPASVASVTEALTSLRQDVTGLKSTKPEDKVSPAIANLAAQIQHISVHLDARGSAQDKLQAIYQDVQTRVNELPGFVQSSVDDLRTSFAEQIANSLAPRQDSEELRGLLIAKSDAEAQLQRLQGANNQLTFEKDTLADRFATMEAENRLLRAQLEEQRVAAVERDIKAAKAEMHATELQEKLSEVASRLQTTEADVQSAQSRASELDSQVHGLTAEKHQLRSKIDSLQLQVSWAERDKENSLRTLAAAEKERDDMAAQQANWDDLRRTAQQVETLTKLLTSSENEELRELRRIRDRSKVLEGEHSALQKRFKDQEGKLAEFERTAVHARQSAASANQKASEAERRAKDLEMELEGARDKLDRAEDVRQQIEADYSLLKSHIQEKELEEAANQEREQKLHDELTQLQIEIVGLKMAAEDGKKTPPASRMHAPKPTTAYKSSTLPNGHAAAYSSSRDTIYPESSRSQANTPKLNGNKTLDGPYTPPTNGAWSSMHAPRSGAPVVASSYFSQHSRASAASPTPSIVSTVTRRDDGWWDAD